MEAIIDLLQSIQLSLIQCLLAGILVFAIGFSIGRRKMKRLNEEIYSLQRDVLDLNAEILYGKDEIRGSETPVIEIQHDKVKTAKLAR